MLFSGECVRVEQGSVDGVFEVVLCRPKKLNAMSPQFFSELETGISQLTQRDECRVIVLRAEGRAFSAGLDLGAAASSLNNDGNRQEVSSKFVRLLEAWRRPFLSLIEKHKVVIAAVQGPCIGGGVDLICAADIRLASQDAFFSIREVKVGMVADLLTLQRIQQLMNASAAAQMAYSGSDYSAKQMLEWGFLSAVYKDADELLVQARKLAGEIAANSPLVLAGIKENLRFSREHNLRDSLNFVSLWNSSYLHSDDLQEAFAAHFEKRTPKYKSKL